LDVYNHFEEIVLGYRKVLSMGSGTEAEGRGGGVEEFVDSGIEKLDQLLGGGVPKGNIVLVSGTSGAGKTILSCQFLQSGCSRGERGLYVAIDEKPSLVRRRMKAIGIDLYEQEQKGLLVMLDAYAARAKVPTQEKVHILGPLEIPSFISALLDNLESVSASRVVIDSITSFGYQFHDVRFVREAIMRIFAVLREVGCTSFVTCEVREGSDVVSRWGIEEYLADGVIKLSLMPTSDGLDHTRMMRVVKMKGTRHPLSMMPFKIGKGGIEIECSGIL
jgi:KaiC/GvpD/RAD55 family RecA-like ATPase